MSTSARPSRRPERFCSSSASLSCSCEMTFCATRMSPSRSRCGRPAARTGSVVEPGIAMLPGNLACFRSPYKLDNSLKLHLMGRVAATHSRQNPSARYRRLLELYREMHARGELMRGIAPEHTFPGSSPLPTAHHVRRLAAQPGAPSILDYGTGQGSQYRPLRLAEEGVARWGSGQGYRGGERVLWFGPGY